MIYKPEIGDVVFVNHKRNVISKIFSNVMGSDFSHSGIIYGELNGEMVLLETNDYCVNINYMQRYIEDNNCLIEVLRRVKPMTTLDKGLIVDHGKPLIGMLYGYLQLPFLALRRLFKLKLRNFSRQGLVCCHVIGYCYQGIESPLYKIDPESFDTQELYEMLILGKFETIYKKGVQ